MLNSTRLTSSSLSRDHHIADGHQEDYNNDDENSMQVSNHRLLTPIENNGNSLSTLSYGADNGSGGSGGSGSSSSKHEQLVYQDGDWVYVDDGNADDTTVSSEVNDNVGGDPDSEEFDRPGGYDKFASQNIDCSRFEHIDDPPPECDHTSEEEEGAGTDPGLFGYEPNQSGFVLEKGNPLPTNLINIQLQLAIQGEPDIDVFKEVVPREVSFLLDRYSPFDCYHFPGYRKLFENSEESQSSVDGEASFDELMYLELVQSWNAIPVSTLGVPTHRVMHDQKSRPPVALYHAWINIEPTHDFNKETTWYLATLNYGAFFEVEYQPPRPIHQPEILYNISTRAQDVLDILINNELLHFHLYQALEEEYESQDNTIMDSTSVMVGSSSPEESNDYVNFGGMLVEIAVVDTWYDNTGRIYVEPLSLAWGTREWFGMGLLFTTLTLVTLLSYWAAFLKRRNAEKQAWSAVLTEQGISNLLQVGWRYHEQEGNGQLYLQVYDKGKMGYNDDNSLLQGGVEQEIIASTLPTATATSMTGGAPRLSGRSDDDSRLPSSTFTASSHEHGEQGSHKYEEAKDQNQ